MRTDAVTLEDQRLEGLDLENYPWIHERHRIFPGIFEPGRYKMVLDIAAGMGVAAKRIHDNYPCYMLCNDISENSITSLKNNNLNAVSFDLDDEKAFFPFNDKSFDAIISLATLEHIINLDHHLQELWRILGNGGHLYISVPNYSGIQYLVPLLFKGKSFHDPMHGELERYEFYAHVRYFMHKTLIEFVNSFGFIAEKVYLPLPRGSSRYYALRKKSRFLSFGATAIMYIFYSLMPTRLAFHPVVQFKKIGPHEKLRKNKPKKVIV